MKKYFKKYKNYLIITKKKLNLKNQINNRKFTQLKFKLIEKLNIEFLKISNQSSKNKKYIIDLFREINLF